MARRATTKTQKVIAALRKNLMPTIGSAVVLICIFLLIFKVITVETLAAIVATLVAAGYIPKSKSDDTASS